MLGLGLEDKLSVKVGVLSGGQRQAMALLMSNDPIGISDSGRTHGCPDPKNG